ncbi:MAG: TRAP transporter small permease [Xanthomonadales bacterium]|nr:TRAP transporter small permease [Xanthomonadales bacterium]
MTPKNTILDKLEKAGTLAENTLLVSILISMILLAAAQIFLRNIFDFSLFWADEMLRLLVLWLTLAGAMVASRMDKQIRIDVLDRFMSAKWQKLNRIFINFFTAAVCALFSWHSARFVMASYEYGDTLLRDTPAWLLQIILPIGFGLMAYRYLVFVFRGVFKQLNSGDAE